MKNNSFSNKGFTLIELIIFIIISAIMSKAILANLNMVLGKTPQLQNQFFALEIADKCMSWYVGQYRLKGFNNFTCPNTLSAPTAFCPTNGNFITSINISCITIGNDPNYKTINVSVSGLSTTSLVTLLASTGVP